VEPRLGHIGRGGRDPRALTVEEQDRRVTHIEPHAPGVVVIEHRPAQHGAAPEGDVDVDGDGLMITPGLQAVGGFDAPGDLGARVGRS